MEIRREICTFAAYQTYKDYMDKETNSYQAIATFVKGFFEAYARGVAETNGIDTNEENRSKVKQVMLEHYEEISKHFFDIVLPGLMRLNYNTMEEAQGQMEKDFMEAKAQDAQFTPGINDYLRTACRHGELYEALVTEYKYNFTWLLQGNITAIGKNCDNYTHGTLTSCTNAPMGVHLLTRIVVKAYAAGLKSKEGDKHCSPNMSTILALLLHYSSYLLSDRAVDYTSTEDPIELFHQVCLNDQNTVNALFNTLEDTMKELAGE